MRLRNSTWMMTDWIFSDIGWEIINRFYRKRPWAISLGFQYVQTDNLRSPELSEYFVLWESDVGYWPIFQAIN